MIELIYCADGNKRFAEIAIQTGFTYGAQLPNTVYFKPEFVDQDWRNPDLDRYLVALRQHSPRMATVLDWEHWGQLETVLNWAEAVAQIVDIIMIIPKVVGGIPHVPQAIGGKPIRLAYSVPTGYGATPVSYGEFYGRPVHILGGSPQLARRLTRFMNIVSVDQNMHLLMATQYNAFFDDEKITRRGYWPTLNEYDGQKWGDGSATADAPYEAFRRSCINIKKMWSRLQQPASPNGKKMQDL